MTEEERESIINEAVERMLRLMPGVVGNLMTANAMYAKISKEFYEKNPDLVNHKDIVKEVVAKVEGQDPTRTYEEILKLALPTIRDMVKMKGRVSMDTVTRKQLNLNFPKLSTDNGSI